jgi:hypothetical protein
MHKLVVELVTSKIQMTFLNNYETAKYVFISTAVMHYLDP